MLYSILPFILVITATISISAYFRKSFAQLFAPVLFAVMLTLYCFYIFEALIWGRLAVILMVLFAIVVPGIVLLRSGDGRKRMLAAVRAPSVRFFILAFFLFVIFALGKFVNLWDSLRLWGAYPKVLHTTQALQLGETSVLYPSMQSYPPGMPLLCYFFTSFSPVFPEKVLFLTYSVFSFSLMLPLLEGVSSGKLKTQIWVFLGILFIPRLISSVNEDYAQFYSSLFIDVPLGLCCGYCLFHAFRRFGDCAFESLRMALVCGCLVLLKDSGSYIALCGIIGAMLCCILRRKGKSLHKAILCMVPAIVIFAFCWGSWSHLRNVFIVSNHLQLDNPIPSVSVLVRIAYRFLITPATSPLTPVGTLAVSLPFALILIFATKILLCISCRREQLRNEIADISVQIICYGGFFLGYCMIFIYQIAEGIYPSYSRYMNTLILSAMYIFSADLICRYPDFLSQLSDSLQSVAGRTDMLGCFFSGVRHIARFVVLATILMSTIMILADRETPDDPVYVTARETADAAVNTIHTANTDGYTDLYLCIPGENPDNYRLHHRIYFELIDDGIRVLNYFDERDITSPELDYTPESFVTHLLDKGYDYVLLTWNDDTLKERFGTLFPEEGSNILYKVDRETLTLVRLG